MKKLVLTLFVLFSLLSNAQAPISPYYPVPLHFDQKWVTPIGYVEHTHVSLNIQNFVAERMQMTSADAKGEDFPGYQIETITVVDKITTEDDQKKLYFAFKVIEVDGHYVTESLKITGDTERLISFFVKFWPTTLHLDDFDNNKIAHRYLLQDEATFYGDRIEVINKTIKSKSEFIEKYEIALNEERQKTAAKLQKKEAEAKRKIAEKVTYKDVTVTVKKSKKGYDFEDVGETLKPYVTDYLKEKDNGTYILSIRSSIQNNNLVDATIYVRDFQSTIGKQLLNRFITN